MAKQPRLEVHLLAFSRVSNGLHQKDRVSVAPSETLVKIILPNNYFQSEEGTFMHKLLRGFLPSLVIFLISSFIHVFFPQTVFHFHGSKRDKGLLLPTNFRESALKQVRSSVQFVQPDMRT